MKAIGAAVIASVGMVDDTVLQCERAQGHQLVVFYDVESRPFGGSEVEARAIGAVLFVKRTEVAVEVASLRRDPGKPPAHAPLVGVQRLEWRARRRQKRHVVMFEVDDRAIEAVREEGAARTPLWRVRTEHEVAYEQLRAPAEELRQVSAALVGFELVGLLDGHPGERTPLSSELVALSGQRFLSIQELLARRDPFLARSGWVHRHRRVLVPVSGFVFLMTGFSPSRIYLRPDV